MTSHNKYILSSELITDKKEHAADTTGFARALKVLEFQNKNSRPWKSLKIQSLLESPCNL